MNLSKKFSKYIEHEENYKTVYNIVRQNSKGKVWLIGGGLSRNLNQLIHGTPQRSFDFDFIVEKGVEKIKLPKGWISRKNKSGYLRFKKGNISIDYIPLKNAGFIVRKKLEPTIENFLLGTPFTVQSLTYNCESKKIIGESGIKAFEKKIFDVNNLEEANILAKKKNMELNDLIFKKAKSMRFRPVLVD